MENSPRESQGNSPTKSQLNSTNDSSKDCCLEVEKISPNQLNNLGRIKAEPDKVKELDRLKDDTGGSSANSSSFGALLRYLLVGGSAFLVDFGLLGIMVSGFKLPAGFSAAVAFIVGAIYSYLMQKYVTFQASKQVFSSAVKYLILLGVNTLITALIVEGFDYFNLYLVGKVFATVLTTIWNFPLMRYWVYKAQKH